MNNVILQKYLQYSKRIAIFGITQWAVIAMVALVMSLFSTRLDLFLDEWIMRTVNNIVTCSSALAIAICSGYYAHSAHDNSLKLKIDNALNAEVTEDSPESGNG